MPKYTELEMEPFKNYVNSLDELHLVALESAVRITKSVALGDSVISGSLIIPVAFSLANYEENSRKNNGQIKSFDGLDLTQMYLSPMYLLIGAQNLVIFKSLP